MKAWSLRKAAAQKDKTLGSCSTAALAKAGSPDNRSEAKRKERPSCPMAALTTSSSSRKVPEAYCKFWPERATASRTNFLSANNSGEAYFTKFGLMCITRFITLESRLKSLDAKLMAMPLARTACNTNWTSDRKSSGAYSSASETPDSIAFMTQSGSACNAGDANFNASESRQTTLSIKSASSRISAGAFDSNAVCVSTVLRQ
mmetsp:Transcript_129301/g.361904  ORF Transcript_129301/g.361904 Transcript_129301/m.361904 type:complete len:203 (+) Transcript_129301:499-1107(+)